mmetsp:Transcript_45733/g.97240  ORF Transcript_45733/g.97240 Transcript_45733/m.97240 type:complete len:510 (-) Transcript_45733:449-1978(-)|eukprot:CAMPEP_0172534672 /NCGR_PEP_ID=MMETSP1067-20121228/6947_1 /TAXON_ID=265564 ORGANISM="Thalassiosira punctigera, Strain Tpunct2005C2" /NCGR_SAMPLE_ID=MMETSP1067 /ASSEMBLY_ACC=CAM_ASM_000444 /LENGTH=509 /DNA_ID=CAMNT_0013319487 /DNA_START=104 /DNA_END=1633 /DNA_ORIENTATION=-
MKAPPAPKVLTAGVRGKGKTWKFPTSKKGKANNSNSKSNQPRPRGVHLLDEEAGGGGGGGSGSPSTPTKDNRLKPPLVVDDDAPPPPVGDDTPSTDATTTGADDDIDNEDDTPTMDRRRLLKIQRTSVKLDDLYSAPPVIHDEKLLVEESDKARSAEYFWLAVCFFGIMGSFVCYGLLLEYATSGGKHLHELSFLFVTSLLYTMTASVGRYARAEKPSTIPPAQFAVLGMTSMGSTFFSVRALRYVIYPIQVLAKSCKPVPVMLMGALMGKKYPAKKYVKVVLIVAGVGLFMGGGDNKKNSDPTEEKDASSQLIGVTLLFISLCFDGGTGAYEDKLMSVHSVGPFDLMYNIQMGKTILSGVGLIVLNQVHVFAQMCQDMGFLLVALGLSGAIGQVFIFVCISKFGALTCSIIGLARKVTTLVASIYFYGHHLNKVQAAGLVICIGAMVNDFFGKKGKKGGGGGHGGGHGGGGDSHGNADQSGSRTEERQPMLPIREESSNSLEMTSVHI